MVAAKSVAGSNVAAPKEAPLSKAAEKPPPPAAAASSKSVAPDDDEDSEGEDDDEVSELRSDRASVAEAGGAFSFHVGKKKYGADDFEMLKVLGKGAFGKVMLVKAKDSGTIYAMKSLSKAVLMERNEVVHTKTERKALEDTHHPFLVHLRFAFQTPTKLYLVLSSTPDGHVHAGLVLMMDENHANYRRVAEVIDALFHPMLRYPKDQNTGEPDLERAPTLKVKLNYWDGAFDRTEIYDMDQQMLFGPGKQDPGKGPIELIPKATNVAVVMRCGGLWFANGKFGCTWKLVQAVVKPRPTLAGRCHIQLGAEDRERLLGVRRLERGFDDGFCRPVLFLLFSRTFTGQSVDVPLHKVVHMYGFIF